MVYECTTIYSRAWPAARSAPLYFPATRVTGIAVDNLVPARPHARKLQAALAQLEMDAHVRLSTDSSLGDISTSYTPEATTTRSTRRLRGRSDMPVWRVPGWTVAQSPGPERTSCS